MYCARLADERARGDCSGVRGGQCLCWLWEATTVLVKQSTRFTNTSLFLFHIFISLKEKKNELTLSVKMRRLNANRVLAIVLEDDFARVVILAAVAVLSGPTKLHVAHPLIRIISRPWSKTRKKHNTS